jgi:hypothetical protein
VTGARLTGGPVAFASLVVVGVVGVVLVLAFVLGRSGPAGAGGATPRSSFSLEQARAFEEFRLFSAGRSVDGLPLTAVLRRDDRANYVSFVYGDCEAYDDEGCAPSAEVQVWPACRRNLALYDGVATRAASPVPERVRVRGVPGAFFEGGTRLELETGHSLVVVFAASRDQALRIATELEALDGSVAEGSPLPLPVDGRGEGGAIGC